MAKATLRPSMVPVAPVRFTCCRVCAILLAVTLGGCALLPASKPATSNTTRGWLADGSLAISRPIPPINTYPSDRASMRPEPIPSHDAAITQATISISRSAGTVTFSAPDSSPLSFHAHVASSLRAGKYTVSLKQTNPVWYAPASYFQQREMRVPAEGSRDRFKRGALGNQALFLNDQTPLHSGPVGTNEIGGLRINPSDMAQLFELAQVGTVVEVR
jgi:hypothetical protein